MCLQNYGSPTRVGMRYAAVLGSACMFSIQVFSLQSSPLAVLRRLACAPDKNAGVKRPGYEANNFRVPCRGSAVAVHSF